MAWTTVKFSAQATSSIQRMTIMVKEVKFVDLSVGGGYAIGGAMLYTRTLNAPFSTTNNFNYSTASSARVAIMIVLHTGRDILRFAISYEPAQSNLPSHMIWQMQLNPSIATQPPDVTFDFNDGFSVYPFYIVRTSGFNSVITGLESNYAQAISNFGNNIPSRAPRPNYASNAFYCLACNLFGEGVREADLQEHDRLEKLLASSTVDLGKTPRETGDSQHGKDENFAKVILREEIRYFADISRSGVLKVKSPKGYKFAVFYDGVYEVVFLYKLESGFVPLSTLLDLDPQPEHIKLLKIQETILRSISNSYLVGSGSFDEPDEILNEEKGD